MKKNKRKSYRRSIFKRVIIDVNDRDGAGYIIKGVYRYRTYFLGIPIKDREMRINSDKSDRKALKKLGYE